MSEYILELANIVKAFDDQKAVNNISISVRRGEFLTLLGPSGCGKTTTLRLIAGFENPTSGSIVLEGEHVENRQPNERNVNTVFQSYALFPHMNVHENIGYGLKIKKVKKPEIDKRVKEMLSLIQLEGFEKRKPDQLSGGQRQRVAIARALINNPKVLLLDEPLGALDLKLRKQMQIELKRLQKKLGITFIYVTHDQEEALNMSDRIAVMNSGVIEQIGTPKEIYEKPCTKFVADFIGESNIFEAAVESIDGDVTSLSLLKGKITLKGSGLRKNEVVYISVRPESMQYSAEKPNDFCLKASVKEHNYVGSMVKISAVLSNGQEIVINNYNKKFSLPDIGTEIWISWNAEDMAVLTRGEVAQA